jgi:hypothetical protein
MIPRVSDWLTALSGKPFEKLQKKRMEEVRPPSPFFREPVTEKITNLSRERLLEKEKRIFLIF